MTSRKADREPSKVSIVLRALVEADDFITAAQLIQRLVGKANVNQISASLHHLRNRHAVASMESDGKLWWYSTPEHDDRSKKVDERVVEVDRRRRRGTASTVPAVKKAGLPKTITVSGLTQSMREANEIADRIRSGKKGN